MIDIDTTRLIFSYIHSKVSYILDNVATINTVLILQNRPIYVIFNHVEVLLKHFKDTQGKYSTNVC